MPPTIKVRTSSLHSDHDKPVYLYNTKVYVKQNVDYQYITLNKTI